MDAVQQSKFEGWAIVDVLGHQRHVGYVTTEHFGSTVLFRIATPAREARERESGSGEYIAGFGYVSEGRKVSEDAAPSSERYVGAGSVYMLTPVSQERALAVLDEIEPRKVLAVDGQPRAPQSDEIQF